MKNLLICFLTPWLLVLSLEARAEKIKIGVVSALTGDDSPTGLDVKDAIVFADKLFGGNKYELIIEDDRCNGKNAVSVANKFINIDHIKYVIGFSCSAATLPAAPLYERAKVTTIVASASSPKISEAGDYIFRTTPNDGDAGIVLSDYLVERFKDVGVISEESDYAQHIGGVFEQNFQKHGGTAHTQTYLPHTFDFRAQLLALREKKVPALFINAQAEKTFALILTQLKNLSWKPALFGAYWPGSPALLSLARDELEGIIFVDTPSLHDVLNPEGKNVLETFYREGGKIRSTEAMFATSVEAYRAMIKTIDSSEEPRKFLYNSTFQGIFGDYTFDSHGEIRGLTFHMRQIKNGVSVPAP